MTLLKSRKFCVPAAVILCIVSLLFGVHKSVAREVREIENSFYEGVYLEDENYTQPALSEQLSNRASAALGIITIAANYDDMKTETDALRDARNGLLEAESIPKKAYYNDKLENAYKAVGEKLSAASLDENEASALSDYAATMSGAMGVIEKSAYNASVSEFVNETMRAFPLNILKGISFCDTPDYFRVEG